MIRTLAFAAALACAAGVAAAQDAPSAPTPTTAPDFVKAAGQSDLFEIEEGKMAETMGGPAVKRFGARMVKDHTMTTANLTKAVKKAGMAPPPPPALRPDQEQMMGQLKGLSGPTFDKAYLAQQVQSHKEALAVQQGYAASGDTPAIKMAAKKTVPIVKAHLAMAEKLSRS